MEQEIKKIAKRLKEIEKKQDQILKLMVTKNTHMSKLETAEIFFQYCKHNKVLLNKAPDLIYPSIYSTREHAVKAIKTLQKKGLLNVQGGYLLIKK